MFHTPAQDRSQESQRTIAIASQSPLGADRANLLSGYTGNQAALRRLPASSQLQRNLRIGSPGDPLEVEADRAANRIMHMPEPAAIDGRAASSVQRQCDTCKDDGEKNGLLQSKPASAAAASEVPPIVNSVLNSPGEPLDGVTRAFMEPRFGADFGHVRIHRDAKAAQSAQAVRASAYTVGSSIAFDGGAYNPGSADGNRLIAHELAHVVQQTAPDDSQTGDDAQPAAVVQRSAPIIARNPPPPSSPPPAAPAPAPGPQCYQAGPADLDHIDGIIRQLGGKIDPLTLKTLQTDKTLAIGLVEDSDGDLTLVYTVSGDWINTALDKATKDLGLTRWDPGEGRRPRGNVGAPGDAEQRMMEAAETNDFVVKAMVVSRNLCGDCSEAVNAYPDGKILVRVTPITKPPAPATPQGAPPAAPGAAPAPAKAAKSVEDEQTPAKPPATPAEGEPPVPAPGAGAPATPKGPVKPAEGETEAPTPGAPATPKAPVTPSEEETQTPAPGAGITPKTPAAETESEGPAPAPKSGGAMKSIGSGLATGAAMLVLGYIESYVRAQVDSNEIDKGIKEKWPEAQKQLIALSSQFDQLKSKDATQKIYGVIQVNIIRGRSFMPTPMGGDPVRESVAMVESLQVTGLSATEVSAETHDLPSTGALDSMFNHRSAYTFSVPLWDRAAEENKAREAEKAKLVEQLRQQAKMTPAKASPPPAASKPADQPQLLPGPAPAPAPADFQPLPGFSGPSPFAQAQQTCGHFEAMAMALIQRGEKLLASSPERAEIDAFLQDESNWRAVARLTDLKFIKDGPSIGHSGTSDFTGMDELLKGDKYGGRLKQIRQNFGG
jgi:hypothetical protein